MVAKLFLFWELIPNGSCEVKWARKILTRLRVSPAERIALIHRQVQYECYDVQAFYPGLKSESVRVCEPAVTKPSVVVSIAPLSVTNSHIHNQLEGA